MNLWRKSIAFVRRSLTLTDPAGWRGEGAASHAGEHVSDANVLALSAAWACVNLLAGTIASLPLMVYRTGPNGARTVAPDHPLYLVLHDSPNADQTALDFFEFCCVSIELRGNAYARVERSADRSRVIAITPVSPDAMQVRRLASLDLEYSWTEDGRSYRLLQNDMLHVRGFGGSPLGGLSTLSFGRNVFGLATAIDKAAGATFRNGLRPSVQVGFDKWLTKEQRDITEEALVKKYAGAMNAGRPFITEGGMKLETISISPEDAQMLESRAFSVEEVCRFFGVPPFMVGHTQKVTSFGTGLEQQVLGFQKFSLRRRLKRIEQTIMKQLLSPADRAAGLTVEFNLEGLLRGDSAARSSFYGAMLNAGVMTINEVRALENLPPVKGGDVPRMQMQNVPITSAPAIGQSGGPALDATDEAA